MCVSPYCVSHLPILADIIPGFAHCFSTSPNDPLNTPCKLRTRVNTHSSPVSVYQPSTPSLETPPAAHFIICPWRTTGPRKLPSTSSTCTTPATRWATTIPTPVALTSTPANTAVIMTPHGSHDDSILTTNRTVCPLAPCRSTDEVKANARGVHTTTVNLFRPDSCPSCRQSLVYRFACIYTLLPTNELYLLSCFLSLQLVDGCSDCPLGT